LVISQPDLNPKQAMPATGNAVHACVSRSKNPLMLRADTLNWL
jgi:hypothetical protein